MYTYILLLLYVRACIIMVVSSGYYVSAHITDSNHLKLSDYEPVCNVTSEWVLVSSLPVLSGDGNLSSVLVRDYYDNGSQLIHQMMCESYVPCKGICNMYDSYCATVYAAVNVNSLTSEDTKTNTTVYVGIGCQCMIRKR